MNEKAGLYSDLIAQKNKKQYLLHEASPISINDDARKNIRKYLSSKASHNFAFASPERKALLSSVFTKTATNANNP